VSLVLAVAAVESSFKPHSTSAAGAVGLMQVMPSVHRDVLPVGSELEVDSNVTAGAYILSGYLTKDGDDIVNALQRYNGNRKDSQAHYAHKVLSKMVEFEAAGSGVRSDKAS
jgi:soluble lytic murein transglycosylase-like protein